MRNRKRWRHLVVCLFSEHGSIKRAEKKKVRFSGLVPNLEILWRRWKRGQSYFPPLDWIRANSIRNIDPNQNYLDSFRFLWFPSWRKSNEITLVTPVFCFSQTYQAHPTTCRLRFEWYHSIGRVLRHIWIFLGGWHPSPIGMSSRYLPTESALPCAPHPLRKSITSPSLFLLFNSILN